MSAPVRISVVTVVLNGADALEETILSVLEQKKRSGLDYLIIDGGSTDGTVELIRKYAGQLSYWVSERDRGIYHAMNKGWEAAADDSFILYLGAGDRIISLPDNMERYRRREVVYGTVRMGEQSIFRSRSDFHLKLYNSLHHQALLVHKGLHPPPPFDVSYRLYADFDFNQRLKKTDARFVCSPEFVVYARPGGVSDRQDFRESLRVVFSNFGFFWATFAVSSYYAMKIFPLLKRLRPIKESRSQ